MSLNRHKNKTLKSINNQLKFITINEGSHTRIIQYLYKYKVIIKLLEQKEQVFKHSKRKIRYVWLETSIYTKMTFARSLWLIQQNKVSHEQLTREQPIGQSFIHQKIDIKKNINEIYYCYDKNFEYKSQHKGIIWGRKYTLSLEYTSYIIIQEFFPSNLIHF
uniref:Chorismate lyase n=1 Tax=Polysiphonia sp. TaxID=1967842 RepID=A0A1Z1MT65_9FLOR|nr:hypothetical protein [Polysiphonia sp.]